MITVTALHRITPSSSGVSRRATASAAKREKPGIAKTLSTTTLPPSIAAACNPSMVTTGNTALRATWRQTIRPQLRPRASSALTKGSRQISLMRSRINRK